MEDEPKVTQEDVGTRIIIAANTGEEILVDDDYDGEYFATHFKWYVITVKNRNGTNYRAVVGRRVGRLGWRKSSDERGGGNFKLARLVAGPLTSSMAKWIVRYRNGNLLDCRSTNVYLMGRHDWKGGRKKGGHNNRPNTLGYRGVASRTAKDKTYYRAIFRKSYLGSYSTLEEAAQAYDEAAYNFYGIDSRNILNFPESYFDID